MNRGKGLLNIVLPMAGRGSRFAQAGYSDPKPLIKVHGKPMIQFVIDNLTPKQPHRFICLVLKAHLDEFKLDEHLKRWAPGCVVIPVDRVTEGAACTVLLAKRYISNDNPLMIANCDQFIDIDINDYLEAFDHEKFAGFIMTMKAHDAKWSFIKLSEQNEVTQVVEKEVVSDEATVGIYNFHQGSSFVEAAEKMIGANLRVNNEFYVAPTYNQLIESGAKIGYYNVGSEWHGMYGLGTPADLEKFISLNLGKSEC